MPLSAFWQRLNFGETLSEEAEKVSRHSKPLPKCGKLHFGAKKVSRQNAESGILGPRKFLATFKLCCQNKAKVYKNIFIIFTSSSTLL